MPAAKNPNRPTRPPSQRPTITRHGRRGRHADRHSAARGKTLRRASKTSGSAAKARTKEGIGATCGAITVKNGIGEKEPVHRGNVRPHSRRRGLLDRGAGARDEPRRLGSRAPRRRCRSPRPRPAGERHAADDHGHRRTGPDADGGRRHLDERRQPSPTGSGCAVRQRRTGTARRCRTRTKQTYTHRPQRRRSHAGGQRNGRQRRRRAARRPAPPRRSWCPTHRPNRREAKSPPTITGIVEQGATLTGHAAHLDGRSRSASPTSGSDATTTGLNCNPISGADRNTYTLVGVGRGARDRASKETATNAAGSGVANSAATAWSRRRAGDRSAAPAISGSPEPGQRCARFHGHWSKEPTELRISVGAVRRRREQLRSDRRRDEQELRAPGSRRGSTAARRGDRAATPPGPARRPPPQPPRRSLPEAPGEHQRPRSPGTLQQGETLTAHMRARGQTRPRGHSLQWLRCESDECVPIEGATKSKYTLTSGEVNFSVAVRETAKNAGGFGAAVSEQDPVGGTPVPFVTGLEPRAARRAAARS